MALPDVQLADLQRAVSHQQALAQCEQTLSKLGVTRKAVDDTGGAAQMIVLHDCRDTIAVASAQAAEIYGLNILANGIQDDSDNVTRFLMLVREPTIPRNNRPLKVIVGIVYLEDGGDKSSILAF